MIERDLHELLTALEVDKASKVVVFAASPQWAEGSEWSDYRFEAKSELAEIPITERECDALLAAGAASGESQPLAGG